MKKTTVLIFIFAILTSCVFASTSYSFVMDAAAYGTLNNPTADYLESAGSMRPSYTVSVDINPVGITTDNLQFSAGVSFLYNSRTPTYQNLYLKGFSSFGPDIKVLYAFEDSKLSASLKGRLLFCTHLNSQDEFAAVSAEAAVGYSFGKKEAVSLVVPVNMIIRKDILSIGGGVGVNIDVAKLFSKAGK